VTCYMFIFFSIANIHKNEKTSENMVIIFSHPTIPGTIFFALSLGNRANLELMNTAVCLVTIS